MFTGEIIDAARALEMGVVNRVVPGPRLREAVLETAAKLAQKPAFVLGLLEAAVYGGFSLDLASGPELEMKTFLTTFAGADRRGGSRPFWAGGRPGFKVASGNKGED